MSYLSPSDFITLAGLIPGIIWETDSSSKLELLQITQVSPQAVKLLGYPQKQWLTKPGFLFSLIHPEDKSLARRHFQQASRSLVPVEAQYRWLSKAGQAFWLSTRLQALHSSEGKRAGFLGISIDHSQTKNQDHLQQEMSRSEHRYRFITENSSDLITLHNADGTFIYVSPVSKNLLGYEPAELIGSSAYDLYHPDDLTTVYQGQASLKPLATATTAARMRKKDGGYMWMETTSQIYRREKPGGIREIISTSRDISERKHSEDAIRHMAFHDALTDLPNRLLLQDRLDVILQHAKRKMEMLAIMFLDLDGFKVINDTLGHQAGDLILKEVAHRLRSSVREEDTVARFGGDEFLIMVSDLTHLENATKLANKVLEVLSQPYTINGNEVQLYASIGIATYPSDGDTSDALLKNADNALYQAKEAGRNTVKVYTPAMQLKASARLLLESGMRRAIERNELEVYYQPIVSLSQNKMTGAEALLRWHHPIKGLIMPGEFIPLAEESGMILSISNWVLLSVATQLAAWRKAGLLPPVISINISPRQFVEEGFLDTLQSVMASHGLSPAMLQLELTERIAMENITTSIPKLRAIKRAGFRVAIDDFGSGYSSLNYLKQLPLDVLKIDQSFTKESDSTSRDETIVQAIITLGHTLNLSVCAEGIETEAQYVFFKDTGCDMVQGFYLSKPMPAKDFTSLLKKGA